MGVLLMLLTIAGLLTGAVLLAISIYTKQKWLGRFVLGAVVVWVAFYFAMLFAVSSMSQEKVLALGQPKEYCGFYLDCHMHTSVTGVRTTKVIGDNTAIGKFYVV